MNRNTIIDGLREIASDKKMLSRSDYWALICEEAAELLEDDAVAMQRVSEPKVMTLQEAMKAIEAVWIENALNRGIGKCVLMPTNNKKYVDVQTFGSGIQHLFKVKTYGKLWRCWSSRPTDAQREATPWPEA